MIVDGVCWSGANVNVIQSQCSRTRRDTGSVPAEPRSDGTSCRYGLQNGLRE
jgi:uncharacterized membrane protein